MPRSLTKLDAKEPGFKLMSDDKIYDYVPSEAKHQDDEDDEPEEMQHNVCPVTSSAAAHVSEKCLT